MPSFTKPLVIRSANLRFEQNRMTMDNLNASLGGTTLRGSLAIRNFAQPEAQFTTDIDQFNAGEWKQLIKTAGPEASKSKVSDKTANSGVFIRIPDKPKSEDDAINRGIEVQIDESGDEWHCTGVLYSMTQAKARPYKPAGEWNTLEITMKGPRTVVKLMVSWSPIIDGLSVVPLKHGRYEPERGPRPDTGYIAIQHHGGDATVWFREISLDPKQ